MKNSSHHNTADDLPEFIIQHIQSFLEQSDGIRSCLLSKSWLQAWSTIPTLRFCKHNISEQKFEETILRYQEHNLLIERLFLKVGSVDDSLDSYLNKWLKIATQIGLKDLELYADPPKYSKFFMLPSSILACKTLRAVMVRGCSLDTPIIKSSSLISLRLYDVRMDDCAISLLLSSCSLIEEIKLSYCTGFEDIRLANLGRLKKLEILFFFSARRPTVHELECQSLIDLQLRCVRVEEQVVRKLACYCPLIEKINLDRCVGFKKAGMGNLRRLKELHIELMYDTVPCGLESHSLRTLVLCSIDIEEPKLDQLFHKCPWIEELTLDNSHGLEKIKVANIHLKRLTISDCTIEDLEINAPSLRSLILRDLRHRLSRLPTHASCVRYKLESIEYLTHLELVGLEMVDDKIFNEFVSKTPFLEQLKVRYCYHLGHIDIANHVLQELTISECGNLTEVKVHSPNLSYLSYSGYMLPTFSLTNGSSTQLKTKVSLWRNLDTSCFLKLRELLVKSHQFVFSIPTNAQVDLDLDLDGLRELSLPVKNVEELSLLIRTHNGMSLQKNVNDCGSFLFHMSS